MMTSPTPEALAPRKRPGWIWAITIFYFLSAGWSTLSIVLTKSRALQMNAAQEAYFASLGVLDYAGMIALSLVMLAAVIQLFRLKRSSIPLLYGAFAVNIGITLLSALRTNFTQAIGGAAFVGMLLGWGLLVAIIIYARRLRKQGVLV
jgi:hypothetical protein